MVNGSWYSLNVIELYCLLWNACPSVCGYTKVSAALEYSVGFALWAPIALPMLWDVFVLFDRFL